MSVESVALNSGLAAAVRNGQRTVVSDMLKVDNQGSVVFDVNSSATSFSIKSEPVADATKTTKVLLQFEKMVLTQFLEMMTKTTQSKILGDGLSADIYNSYFAKATAENIVQSGGLGIAKLVAESQSSEKQK